MKNITLYFEVIYLLIALWITFVVGRNLYKEGLVLIADLFESKIVSERLNKLLLIGYYLVNMGYSAISVQELSSIHNLTTGLEVCTFQVGFLMLILAFLHFNNLLVLSILEKNRSAVRAFFES